MANKIFEMSFQIGGKLKSSFSQAFSGANNKLTALKNEARQTQRALDDLGRQFRNGKIYQEQYEASTRELTNRLATLNRQIERVNTAQLGLKSIGNTFSNGLARAKDVSAMVALGSATTAVGAAFKSLNTAADFEQQITKVGVIADASSSELKKLNDTALKLGASTSLSASEVAQAMGELAAKGMDTNKIVSAMPGIIAAAESSGEDLALTSEVVTSALNAFQLSANKASHVADVMAMSAKKTAAGVEDLGYSFKYAAPVANTLGISLEELAAATGIMVDKGLSGEQAGTSLRMALIRLSKPPTDARKALEKLGISVVDKNKKFKSLTQITEEWNKATKDLTETEKVQYAAAIFGTEAATGMLNLFASGPEKIDSLTKSLEKSSGAAQKAAKAMKENYKGSLEQLKGSIESAQIAFATPVLPVFQNLFEGITESIDQNIGGIEKSGQKLADVLENVFAPFSAKPEFDPSIKDPDYIENYNKQLREYNKFKNMDFGDKFIYALDEATKKTEKWLEGSGGETMNQIFTKLGEIAAKAWWNSFSSSVKSSISNLGEGNIFAALAMGAVANKLTGGLLVKGGATAGKWLFNKGKDVVSHKAGKGIGPSTSAKQVKTASKTTVKDSTLNKLSKSLSTHSKGVLGKTTKVLGKAATPLAVAGTAVEIATAKNKKKAAISGVGGLAGSFAGAKAGAAIGTLIFPGIGTAVGSAVGGIAGYAGGKWLGNKATTTVSSKSAVQSSASMSTNEKTLSQTTSKISKEGQSLVKSLSKSKTSANKLASHVNKLASNISQAKSWLNSLKGIKTASKRVEKELNSLAKKIASVQVPSNIGSDKRVSFHG